MGDRERKKKFLPRVDCGSYTHRGVHVDVSFYSFFVGSVCVCVEGAISLQRTQTHILYYKLDETHSIR